MSGSCARRRAVGSGQRAAGSAECLFRLAAGPALAEGEATVIDVAVHTATIAEALRVGRERGQTCLTKLWRDHIQTNVRTTRRRVTRPLLSYLKCMVGAKASRSPGEVILVEDQGL